MEITKVNIRQVEMNKVKAMASITIDEQFVVHDLRVVEGERGFFVAMPSRKLPNGEYRDIAHPINTETREMVQAAVLSEFEAVTSVVRQEEPAKAEEPVEAEEPAKVEETVEAEEPAKVEEPAVQEETVEGEEPAPVFIETPIPDFSEGTPLGQPEGEPLVAAQEIAGEAPVEAADAPE